VLSRTRSSRDVPYPALFGGDVASEPVSIETIAELLRCSMGLSAWKQYAQTRWALRVNPSSGNLHPTEAYVVHDGRAYHYAPRDHELETRCVFDPNACRRELGAADEACLVALTSIHWREAWKYGERAFRYCQHDVGHALGALRLAAAMLGWQLTLLPRWSDEHVAALLGLDRDADYESAEREEPDCVALVSRQDRLQRPDPDPVTVVEAARSGTWHGVASRLSPDRVEWPVIDEVAHATRYPGVGAEGRTQPSSARVSRDRFAAVQSAPPTPSAHAVILQRRSAVAFDGQGSLRRDQLLSMLERLRPSAAPWDAVYWRPQVHLALFVHRVDGLTPGLYAYLRDEAVQAEWRTVTRREFLWERESEGLFLLVPADCRSTAMRLSCDQAIAADGFLSLGMIARVAGAIREWGEWFYRRLFWECGLIGQVLYLEAEMVGARATGIGCFYDDPVHELLGLTGHEWQSLYHFSMGIPVEDRRLTTEPGYSWEGGTPTNG
jgi:SagB-type dehydrogenase family enzyme